MYSTTTTTGKSATFGNAYTPGLATPNKVYEEVYSEKRIAIQRWLANMVDRETLSLTRLQKTYRSEYLDLYFKFTAIIGNHMFFFSVLPLLHWFGLGVTARGTTYIIMWTVYLTGIAKDYFSAPRPRSPPVQRLSFNSDHSIEYGFPSTHTAYVIATVLYVSSCILEATNSTFAFGLLAFIWFIGASIIIGRVYCGMHTILDVGGGVVMGGAIAWLFINYYPTVDKMMSVNGIEVPLIILLIQFCVIYFHPSCVDECPCYVDNTSAISVFIGGCIGNWQMFKTLGFDYEEKLATTPYGYHDLGFLLTATKVITGVAILVVWKLASKPLMIKIIDKLRSQHFSSHSYEKALSETYTKKYTDALIDSGYISENSPNASPTASKDPAAIDPSEINKMLTKEKKYCGSPCMSMSSESVKAGRYGTYFLIFSSENLSRIPTYFGIGYLAIGIIPIIYEKLGLISP
ncbi:Long-chain base-1-phosphate phosphatase [Mycoemilia scoparia]|uniref:Long-chain base-1-phosphate phosphatase n=1 Tax=Mycoemilia scoparia TaxID=417184 RepID=A0A9W8DSW0_9FUNG|nr:Long-chain base-1-phosphate phosphatase [Mycoemilia scoparia]